jgi:hypothetical protein
VLAQILYPAKEAGIKKKKDQIIPSPKQKKCFIKQQI